MREFILYSRTGYTTPDFVELVDGGRLDIVYQSILMSIFKAQSHRHDVIFHAVLNGPRNPPLHIEINGNDLRDARIDEADWNIIIKKILRGKEHEGIKTDKKSLQEIIKEKSAQGYSIFVLNSKGDSIDNLEVKDNMLFVIGDHIGIPKKDEQFLLRYGSKLSLGKVKYLAASCIDIINYEIDRKSILQGKEENQSDLE
ncbi:MAG: tRNA (pseudouridine(54)-N(1))-methyltransferase TrmY [Candidatus Micrarchaeia archaeon]